jgi:hypothetical protein
VTGDELDARGRGKVFFSSPQSQDRLWGTPSGKSIRLLPAFLDKIKIDENKHYLEFCIQFLRLSCNVLSQSKFTRSKTS